MADRPSQADRASQPVFDPRPVLSDEQPPRVEGQRCTACGYPTATFVLACPVCGGDVQADRFGPDGTVAASTCLHVRIPGRTPPYAVAYLDLDDGPRVLAHTAGTQPAPLGSRMQLAAKNDSGDLTAEPLAGREKAASDRELQASGVRA